MKALGEKLAKHSQKMDEQRQSYASVTASRPQRPTRPVALLSVAVTSKNEEKTADEVLEAITKINANEGWIKVDRVRKAKNRKIIMGFGTAEDRKKAKDKLAQEGADLVREWSRTLKIETH